VLAETRARLPETPLVPMTYASLLEAYGWERFAADARAAGAASLIVADLPAGERPELRRVQLVAPTSTDERVRLAAEQTDGWLYLVTLAGTTGARETLSLALAGLVERARRATRLPCESPAPLMTYVHSSRKGPYTSCRSASAEAHGSKSSKRSRWGRPWSLRPSVPKVCPSCLSSTTFVLTMRGISRTP